MQASHATPKLSPSYHQAPISPRLSVNLLTHPNTAHNRKTRYQKRPSSQRDHPLIHRPSAHLHPHAPSPDSLRARVHVSRVRQEHAYAQESPDAVVVHQAEHDGFGEGKVQPAAEELGVDELACGLDGGQGVARHGAGVHCWGE